MANEQVVMVACKAPNGLVLNLDKYVPAGDRGLVRRIAGKKTVTLKGYARSWGAPDTTEGGYALTPVEQSFWEAWYELNKDSSLILDKIILPPHRDALGKAVDHAEVPQMFAPVKEKDGKGATKLSNKD